MMEHAFKLVSREMIFERTGLQFMQINTLFQLFSMRKSATLELAQTFLMIPDLFNFWLTGRKTNEYSDATTTQFFNLRTGEYDQFLLENLGLPTDIYPEIIPSGTVIDMLAPSVREETGLGKIPVIAPACHDTGSAVAATPIQNPRSAYISSGTWSLIGVELAKPVISEKCLVYNFTNEGGVYNTIRLLKNVAGMWLVQECRRVWESQGRRYSWEDLISLASEAPPFGPVVNPDHIDFLNPVDMPQAIRKYCDRIGQEIPENNAGILRCIFESLALKYRWVINRLEEMLGYRLEVIHIIGGGSQNGFLCQLTANATGKTVIAGPVEATAIGNALVQAISLGILDSLSDGRQLVRQSFPLVTYEPERQVGWDMAAETMNKLLACD
jgi:rhamnulokinase